MNDLDYLERLIKENPGKFTDLEGDDLSAKDLMDFINIDREASKKIRNAQNDTEVVLIIEKLSKTKKFIPSGKFEKYKTKLVFPADNVEVIHQHEYSIQDGKKNVKTRDTANSLINYSLIILFILFFVFVVRKVIKKDN